MKIMTAKSKGTRMVDTLNARPRICSRYSRLATSSRLRIGLASHGLNEDLFERGLDQFETVDGGDGGRFVQQLLRVAVRMKANLGVAGEVLGLGNLSAVEEAGVAIELDDYPVALVA